MQWEQVAGIELGRFGLENVRFSELRQYICTATVLPSTPEYICTVSVLALISTSIEFVA